MDIESPRAMYSVRECTSHNSPARQAGGTTPRRLRGRQAVILYDMTAMHGSNGLAGGGRAYASGTLVQSVVPRADSARFMARESERRRR